MLQQMPSGIVFLIVVRSWSHTGGVRALSIVEITSPVTYGNQLKGQPSNTSRHGGRNGGAFAIRVAFTEGALPRGGLVQSKRNRSRQ